MFLEKERERDRERERERGNSSFCLVTTFLASIISKWVTGIRQSENVFE